MQPSISKVTPDPGPLSPVNLLLAGVTARDVIWFRRLSPSDQMRSLHQTERGAALLAKVREYNSRATAGSAMPLAA